VVERDIKREGGRDCLLKAWMRGWKYAS